jgi:hypothetical protein
VSWFSLFIYLFISKSTGQRVGPQFIYAEQKLQGKFYTKKIRQVSIQRTKNGKENITQNGRFTPLIIIIIPVANEKISLDISMPLIEPPVYERYYYEKQNDNKRKKTVSSRGLSVHPTELRWGWI